MCQRSTQRTVYSAQTYARTSPLQLDALYRLGMSFDAMAQGGVAASEYHPLPQNGSDGELRVLIREVRGGLCGRQIREGSTPYLEIMLVGRVCIAVLGCWASDLLKQLGPHIISGLT